MAYRILCFWTVALEPRPLAPELGERCSIRIDSAVSSAMIAYTVALCKNDRMGVANHAIEPPR